MSISSGCSSSTLSQHNCANQKSTEEKPQRTAPTPRFWILGFSQSFNLNRFLKQKGWGWFSIRCQVFSGTLTSTFGEKMCYHCYVCRKVPEMLVHKYEEVWGNISKALKWPNKDKWVSVSNKRWMCYTCSHCRNPQSSSTSTWQRLQVLGLVRMHVNHPIPSNSRCFPPEQDGFMDTWWFAY